LQEGAVWFVVINVRGSILGFLGRDSDDGLQDSKLAHPLTQLSGNACELLCLCLVSTGIKCNHWCPNLHRVLGTKCIIVYKKT
jgi:hypothetical protein